MKKILCIALLLVTTTAFAQIEFLKFRTMQVGDLKLYVVSPADLGYPKNVIAATYDDIVAQAATKGYRPCPEYVANSLFKTYSDGETGRNWSAFKWLKILTPYTLCTVGKDDDGKFMDESARDTYHVFLNYKHACLVFVK